MISRSGRRPTCTNCQNWTWTWTRIMHNDFGFETHREATQLKSNYKYQDQLARTILPQHNCTKIAKKTTITMCFLKFLLNFIYFLHVNRSWLLKKDEASTIIYPTLQLTLEIYHTQLLITLLWRRRSFILCPSKILLSPYTRRNTAIQWYPNVS